MKTANKAGWRDVVGRQNGMMMGQERGQIGIRKETDLAAAVSAKSKPPSLAQSAFMDLHGLAPVILLAQA